MGEILILGCQKINAALHTDLWIKVQSQNGFGEKFMHAIYINFTGFLTFTSNIG